MTQRGRKSHISGRNQRQTYLYVSGVAKFYLYSSTSRTVGPSNRIKRNMKDVPIYNIFFIKQPRLLTSLCYCQQHKPNLLFTQHNDNRIYKNENIIYLNFFIMPQFYLVTPNKNKLLKFVKYYTAHYIQLKIRINYHNITTELEFGFHMPTHNIFVIFSIMNN